jgi:anthranilate phosphoribosyltransferase
VAGGGTEEWFIEPDEYGIELADLDAIAGGDPAENAEVVRRVLAGEPGPARDVVTLNAAAAILAADAAIDLEGGIERARKAIDSGAATDVLERLIALTGELAA